jgi:hypothetical protein
MTLDGRLANQRILLTLTYRCAIAPATNKSEQEVTEALVARVRLAGVGSIAGEYLRCLPDSYTFVATRGQLIWPTRFRQRLTAEAAAGFVTSAATPNIAAIITFQTLKAGRDQVANKHIGPWPVTFQTQGSLTAGGQTQLDALKATIAAPIDLQATNFGLWSPCIFHKTPKPGGLVADDVTQSTTNPFTRTMRRRTVGLGE